VPPGEHYYFNALVFELLTLAFFRQLFVAHRSHSSWAIVARLCPAWGIAPQSDEKLKRQKLKN
jgi:hypothetical protein